MSTYDERAQALAARMLAPKSAGGKGQAVTYTFTVAGAYDTATGVAGAGATTTQDCSGVEKSYDSGKIDGTQILEGDTEFVMSPLTVAGVLVSLPIGVPSESTLTLADGSVRSVVRIAPKRPAGLLVSVTLQLRGA